MSHLNGTMLERAAHDGVTVRWADARDREQIRRLAQRDSRRAPAGATLVAEVSGRIVAAVAVAGGETIADPFLPTRDVVELLELRAAQLSDGDQPKGRGVASPLLARTALSSVRRNGSPTGVAQPHFAGR